jgi:mRNA-degrading endonuclease RelE of RelBE toxin-antitoxin system
LIEGLGVFGKGRVLTHWLCGDREQLRVAARQVAAAALPQYNPDMRRLFLFPRYQREVARFLGPGEQDEMERHIADDPERHPRIPGGSGMRKARWARPGRGKRGGVRVIYYFAAPDAVYLIAVYAKNEKENLSDAEKQTLAKILRPVKQQEHQARPRTD